MLIAARIEAGATVRCSAICSPESTGADAEAEERHEDQALPVHAEMLWEVSERIDDTGGHPFAPTVRSRLWTTAVMRDWLREQLDRAEA